VCTYLTVFLTRFCYTVNELIYDVSRIYLLTWQDPHVVVTSSSYDVVTTTYDDSLTMTYDDVVRTS